MVWALERDKILLANCRFACGLANELESLIRITGHEMSPNPDLVSFNPPASQPPIWVPPSPASPSSHPSVERPSRYIGCVTVFVSISLI